MFVDISTFTIIKNKATEVFTISKWLYFDSLHTPHPNKTKLTAITIIPTNNPNVTCEVLPNL